ncbi:MAG: TetR/AcrR family transcriptional regulator [candidate division FCPU426 bacterium]
MGTRERKQLEKRLRQEDILRAAEKLFFDRGIKLTTMDDVAKAAEYSKRTVYCYFKSKEQMVHALVLRALKILNERIRAVMTVPPATALDTILELCKAFVDYASCYPDYFRMLSFYEQWELDPKERDEYKEACLVEGRRIFELMVDVLRRGQRDGSIRRQADTAGTALVLYAHVMGVANLLINRKKYSAAVQPRTAREVTSTMTDFVVRALRGKA